jgi:ADP-heptose:LPS heptosyltransferase
MDMSRVLLVRTDRIGDVVLITPAIELLKKHFPNIKISVLVSEYAKDILTANPHIDEIITVKPFWQLVKELKSKKFDSCILFFVEPKSALACFLAGISKRIAPASKIWSIFANIRIFQHRSKTQKHEADFNIELLKPLGIEPQKSKTRIYLTDEENTRVKQLLKKNYGVGEQDVLVCIHPGSKGSAKNWLPQNFAKLADEIIKKHPKIKVVLTGNNKEQPLLNQMSQTMQNKPMLLKPLALRSFIAVLNQSKIVITNSTGPLHIADALGKKTLSFFPNIKGCLPFRWGPYGEGHIVLTPHNEECSECKVDGCMSKITVENALESFEELLTST